MTTGPFSATSRYNGIEIASFETAEGRTITYVRRRFLPTSTNAIILAEHIVTQGERLDNITARYITDPEQFWFEAIGHVVEFVPEDSGSLNNALNEGRPLVRAAPRASISKSFAKLAVLLNGKHP